MRQADPEELLRPVDLGLGRDELRFIAEGLRHWGGPVSPQPESAVLAGFDSVTEMYAGTACLRRRLECGEALSRRGWRQVIILTELIFGSDTFGAGVEWETVTGRNDVTDLRLLRDVQRKLVAVCPPEG